MPVADRKPHQILQALIFDDLVRIIKLVRQWILAGGAFVLDLADFWEERHWLPVIWRLVVKASPDARTGDASSPCSRYDSTEGPFFQQLQCAWNNRPSVETD